MSHATAGLDVLRRGGNNRPSSSSSAAEAAAAAEFAAKKFVWIPDRDAGFLSAWVVKEDASSDTVTVALSDGSVSRGRTFV